MSTEVEEWLDDLDNVEDVEEELVHIEFWNKDILFRGLSLAAVELLSGDGGTDIAEAQAGNFDQAVKMVRATACHPVTKELLFVSERAQRILSRKNHEGVMECLNKGTLMVLGLDEDETAGKGSSSTKTAAKAAK